MVSLCVRRVECSPREWFNGCMRKKVRLQQGFTLAEIVIVFAIIALITTAALGTGFISSRQSARDARRRNNVRNLATALEAYFNDHNQYPASNNGVIVACGPAGADDCDWGDAFTDENGTIYMARLPDDPGSNQYLYRSSGIAWQLYVALENEDHPDLDRNEDGVYTSADDGWEFVDCGPGYCNFGLSSGNTTVDTNPL